MAESNALNFVKAKCTIISIANETEGKLGPFSGTLKNMTMIYDKLCSMTCSDMFCDEHIRHSHTEHSHSLIYDYVTTMSLTANRLS